MYYVLAINVHEKGIIFRFKLVSRMGSSKSHNVGMLTAIYICSANSLSECLCQQFQFNIFNAQV